MVVAFDFIRRDLRNDLGEIGAVDFRIHHMNTSGRPRVQGTGKGMGD